MWIREGPPGSPPLSEELLAAGSYCEGQPINVLGDVAAGRLLTLQWMAADPCTKAHV